jgi:hypothetical protein
MRHGLLALLGIALCIGLQLLVGASDRFKSGALNDDAHTAIDLRCSGRDEPAAADCRRLFEKLYLAGALAPESTLRAYCTPVALVAWGERPPALPEQCTERAGGSQRG